MVNPMMEFEGFKTKTIEITYQESSFASSSSSSLFSLPWPCPPMTKIYIYIEACAQDY